MKEESFEDLLPRYEFGYLADQPQDWSRAADERFQTEEFRALVRNLVDSLPEDLKAAYVLKDLEELSEDEVCGILEISKPTMKNRVHRARLILRKKIEEAYAPA
jgi:RNA polymerase sigma-70 factor (ECF subfamily)